MRTLVTYACNEYNDRIDFFIKHGIFEADDVDFLFVINNTTLKLDVPPFVKVMNRDNTGYDFGGWSYGLLTDDNYKKYECFIFLNQSIVGPFHKDTSTRWTDVFIGGLTNDIRLFGSTISTRQDPIKFPHVQSYAFCVNQETLKFLIDKEIFSLKNIPDTKDDAIFGREIQMSLEIIKNGWNIGSLDNYYRGVDFRFKDKKPEEYDIVWLDDFTYPNFESILFTREDVLFLKGNRGFMY